MVSVVDLKCGAEESVELSDVGYIVGSIESSIPLNV